MIGEELGCQSSVNSKIGVSEPWRCRHVRPISPSVDATIIFRFESEVAIMTVVTVFKGHTVQLFG